MSLRHELVKRVTRNRALHRLALKVYSIAHPPPYRRPNMEFESDAWNGISSLHYRGGRQLGEDNTGPYPYWEVTGNRYEICRFPDSRRGLPMNITNLQLVMPFAADAYCLTTVLRNRYREKRGLARQQFNLVEAYLFSKMAVTLPAFLTRRQDHPVRDGDIESLEAAFYMLGTAPFMLVRQLMARGDRRALDAEPMGGDMLYRLAAESRTLISSRERACPATAKLIREYYDVIMNGAYDGSLESPAVDRVLERLGDWDRFYSYSLAASRIELLVLLNKALTLQFLLRLEGDAALACHKLAQQVQTALVGPLTTSRADPPADRSARAVLDTVVNVLVALLRDHGDAETLDALAAVGGLPIAPSQAIAPRDVSIRMRDVSSRIHRSCQRDLHLVHVALSNGRCPSIDVGDLLRRTGGPALAEHLRRLES